MTGGWRGGARRRPGNDDSTRVGFVVSDDGAAPTRLVRCVVVAGERVSAVCPDDERTRERCRYLRRNDFHVSVEVALIALD